MPSSDYLCFATTPSKQQTQSNKYKCESHSALICLTTKSCPPCRSSARAKLGATVAVRKDLQRWVRLTCDSHLSHFLSSLAQKPDEPAASCVAFSAQTKQTI